MYISYAHSKLRIHGNLLLASYEERSAEYTISRESYDC